MKFRTRNRPEGATAFRRADLVVSHTEGAPGFWRAPWHHDGFAEILWIARLLRKDLLW